MADILIRGMEMPKDGHVIVRIYANGDVCEPTPCPGVWGKVARVTPLPEGHGRLIDADALQAKFEMMENASAGHGRPYSFSFKDGGEMCAEWWTVQDALAREPTIVPAEGGTDDDG